jgi:hypothetical protein
LGSISTGLRDHLGTPSDVVSHSCKLLLGGKRGTPAQSPSAVPVAYYWAGWAELVKGLTCNAQLEGTYHRVACYKCLPSNE